MIGQINVGGGVAPEDFINGIIQEAKAQGVVNAGDFVRFLSDYSESNKSSDTQLDTNANTGKVISAVALNENKVFIAYRGGTSSSYELYGFLCTINGATITKSATVNLNTLGFGGEQIVTVQLNENKVLVLYNINNTNGMCGLICTINGNTITVGTNTVIASAYMSGKIISAVKLDEGKIFITHSYGTDYHLYGIICTINEMTITKGTDTQLFAGTGGARVISAVALSSNKVAIAYSYDLANGSTYTLHIAACQIAGTTITVGSSKTPPQRRLCRKSNISCKIK